MIFATLAIGTGVFPPDVPILPTPSTSTAAWPSRGQANAGELPGKRTYAARVRWIETGGALSVAIRHSTATATRTSTSAPTAPHRGRREDTCLIGARAVVDTASGR